MRESSRSSGADEHVPERLPANLFLIRIAARAGGGQVQIGDAAFTIERAEQGRRGIDGRLEELELGAQLGLEPLVVEPEPGGGGDRVDELALVRQHRVVDQGRGRAARVLDECHRAAVAFLGERLAVGRDVPAGLGQPVRNLERRVAQRLSDCIADRRSSRECQEDVADAGACEPAAQNTGEERNRHERKRDEEDVVERVRRSLGEGADDELDQEDEHHECARAEHRAERAPEGSRGPHEADHDDEEDRRDERERQHADRHANDRRGGVAVGDGDHALAVRA